MVLIARNLRVDVRHKTILHGLDFRAEPGQFIGIVGPTGSGKSTLLKTLSGARRATSGTVSLGDRDIHVHFESVKHSIGYVPTDDLVPPALPVERGLLYAAELRLADSAPELREERVERVIERLGLGPHRHQRVDRLSGDMRKGVSLGVELLGEPTILLADAPTRGLGPTMERALLGTFRALTDAGMVVVVTSTQLAGRDWLDRVGVLEGGRLVYFGDVAGCPAT